MWRHNVQKYYKVQQSNTNQSRSTSSPLSPLSKSKCVLIKKEKNSFSGVISSHQLLIKSSSTGWNGRTVTFFPLDRMAKILPFHDHVERTCWWFRNLFIVLTFSIVKSSVAAECEPLIRLLLITRSRASLRQKHTNIIGRFCWLAADWADPAVINVSFTNRRDTESIPDEPGRIQITFAFNLSTSLRLSVTCVKMPQYVTLFKNFPCVVTCIFPHLTRLRISNEMTARGRICHLWQRMTFKGHVIHTLVKFLHFGIRWMWVKIPTLSWIELDWVTEFMDWVGFDLGKWTRVQLGMGVQLCAFNCTSKSRPNLSIKNFSIVFV